MDFRKHAENLFMNSELADVTFSVDGEEFPGHRLILALCCPYFKVMLHGGLPESQSKVITLTMTPAKQFKEVLRYCYQGRLNIAGWTMDDLLALLSLAHEYQFDALVTRVVIALEEQPMDFEYWDLTRNVASTLELDILKAKCTSFEEKSLEKFLKKDSLERFTGKFVLSMLNTPAAGNCDQTRLLESIAVWKMGQKSRDLKSVLKQVDWSKVSPAITSIIITELIEKLSDPGECEFWEFIHKHNIASNGSTELTLEPCDSHDEPKVIFSTINMILPKGKLHKLTCRGSTANIFFEFQSSEIVFCLDNCKPKIRGFAWEFCEDNVQVIEVIVYGKKLGKALEVISDPKSMKYCVWLPSTVSGNYFAIKLAFSVPPPYHHFVMKNFVVYV